MALKVPVCHNQVSKLNKALNVQKEESPDPPFGLIASFTLMNG